MPRLVEYCLRGDDRAWRILVERYQNLVYSIALKFGAPHQDASDIFQSVWLELFHELPRLREAEALQAWLVRGDHAQMLPMEAWAAGGTGVLEDGEPVERAHDAGLPPDILAAVEREQLVRDSIGLLPPRCREMIEMLFLRTASSPI